MYICLVENYERKAVRYYDDGPHRDEEVKVTSANRVQDYVKKASAILEVFIHENMSYIGLNLGWGGGEFPLPDSCPLLLQYIRMYSCDIHLVPYVFPYLNQVCTPIYRGANTPPLMPPMHLLFPVHTHRGVNAPPSKWGPHAPSLSCTRPQRGKSSSL